MDTLGIWREIHTRLINPTVLPVSCFSEPTEVRNLISCVWDEQTSEKSPDVFLFLITIITKSQQCWTCFSASCGYVYNQRYLEYHVSSAHVSTRPPKGWVSSSKAG